MIELLDGMEINCCEGDISCFPNRQNILKKILETYPPYNILEIGFNLGYSMKLILDTLTNDSLIYPKNIIIFDICEGTNNGRGGGHNYVKKNFNILKNAYPDINIVLVEGDSVETVKPYLTKLNIKFDFIEIDGFHEREHPKKDIENTIDFLNIGGIIYIDDYNITYDAITTAVDSRDWSNFDTYYNEDVFYACRIK